MTPPITNHARTAAQREAGRRRSKKYYTLRQIQRDNARHVAGLVAGLIEYKRRKGIS